MKPDIATGQRDKFLTWLQILQRKGHDIGSASDIPERNNSLKMFLPTLS